MSNNGKTAAGIIAYLGLNKSPIVTDAIEDFLNEHNKEVINDFFNDDDELKEMVEDLIDAPEYNNLLFFDNNRRDWLIKQCSENIAECLLAQKKNDFESWKTFYNILSSMKKESDAIIAEKEGKEDEENPYKEYVLFPNGNYYGLEEDPTPTEPYILYDGDNTIDELVDFAGKENILRFLNEIM